LKLKEDCAGEKQLREATELYLEDFPLEGSDVDKFDFAHYL
jgi:hypothetical protein